MVGGKSNGENRDRNGHVLVWEQPGIQDAHDDVLVERRKGKGVLFTFGIARAGYTLGRYESGTECYGLEYFCRFFHKGGFIGPFVR